MKALSYAVFGFSLAFMAVSMLAPQYAATIGVKTSLGVTLAAFDVVVVLAFLGLGWWFLTHLDTPLTRLELAAILLIVAYVAYELLVVVAFGVAGGLNPIAMLRAVSPRLSVVLLPVLYALLRGGVRPEVFVRAVTIVGVAVAVVVIARYFVIGPIGGVSALGFRLREAWGGSVLLFGWLLLSAITLRKNTLVSLGLSLLAVLAMALANHRSGYVALLAALLFYVAANRRRSGKALLIASLAAVGVIAVISFMPVVSQSAVYSARTMFSVDADINTQDRVVSSVAAWRDFSRRPFGDVAWHPTDNYTVGRWDAHNVVFQVLAAEGLVGFFLHTALWGVIFLAAFRHRRADALLRFSSAYMVFYLTFCLFNTNFYAPENAVLLTGVGAVVLAVVANMQQQPAGVPRHLTANDVRLMHAGETGVDTWGLRVSSQARGVPNPSELARGARGDARSMFD